MQQKILDFLKKSHGYVSGEEISSRLEISRQALWKHIQSLKDSGYEIEAVPHLGYQLISAPDRLFSSEITSRLNTKFTGKKIYYFDDLPSTMDIATELALKGAVEGTLVLAEAQTKGRGRQQREWHSPKYKGVYLSLILRPEIMPNSIPLLTLVSAVSVCEAIKEELNLEAQIKWPNDIFSRNKKLGGILTELNAETDSVRFVVIGIGINVNNDKKALIEGAASLKEEKGRNIDRIALLVAILQKIENNYLLFQQEGAKTVIQKWRQLNITIGKRVKVTCHKQHLEGTAVDIDTDGGLLVRKDSGIVQKVMAGDVVHCR